jgi:menaquinone-dependent protoporphyrinogen IX oxidase
MKGIIIYKGKYGATQQYAEWLSAELNLPVVPADKIRGIGLTLYDFFLIGTSVYTGKLQIQQWLRKNLSFIRGKKIFFFQVAGVPPQETGKREAYNRSGIPGEIAKQGSYFYLPGRMVLKKLSWKDRLLVKMGARLSKDPAEKGRMLSDYNRVKIENLVELIGAVNSYLPSSAKPVAETLPVL